MIKKKGWLKNAEARLNGFYINGKKEKTASLTQKQVDEWNGVKPKAAPKPKPVPKPEPVEEIQEKVEEPVLKKIFKKARKKK